MRLRLAIALGLLTVTSLEAQSRPYRLLPALSCPYADRLLGPLKEDSMFEFREFYDAGRDSSYLVTGSSRLKSAIYMGSIEFAGRGPVRRPAMHFTYFLHGGDAQKIADVTRYGPVQLTFVLDDSSTVYPRATVGHLERTSRDTTLVVTALLKNDEALQITRARVVFVQLGPLAYVLSEYQSELKVLIRAAVCPR